MGHGVSLSVRINGDDISSLLVTPCSKVPPQTKYIFLVLTYTPCCGVYHNSPVSLVPLSQTTTHCAALQSISFPFTHSLK